MPIVIRPSTAVEVIEKIAVEFIKSVTTASRLGTIPVQPQVLQMLRRTVRKDMVLYRGLGFNPKTLEELDGYQTTPLIVGAACPTDLLWGRASTVSHQTKKLSIAQGYADNGSQVQVVMKTIVPAQYIIADLTNLAATLPVEKYFSESDLDYFTEAQEVLVYKDSPVTPMVVSFSVKGKS